MTTSAFTATFEVFCAEAGCTTDVALEAVSGRLLLAVDTRARVRLYDCDDDTCCPPSSGSPLRSSPLGSCADAVAAHDRAITTCAWLPRDGGLFVTGGADGRVVVWSPLTVRPVARVDIIPQTAPVPVLGGGRGSGGGAGSGGQGGGPAGRGGSRGGGGSSGGRVHCVAMSPCASAHSLLAVGSDDPCVRLVDLASGAGAQMLSGHREGVMALAWSPVHEFQLASGSRDGTLRVYDVRRSGATAVLASLDMHSRRSKGASVGGGMGDGALGAAGGNPSGDPARAAAPACAHGVGGVNGLLWVPPSLFPRPNGALEGGDATLLSTGRDSALRAWGVEASPDPFTQRSIDGDASDLLRTQPGGVRAWNTLRSFDGARNRARRCVRLAMGVACVGAARRVGTPSPEALVVFLPAALPRGDSDVGAGAGTVGAWDFATGAPLGVLSGHLASVNALVWRDTPRRELRRGWGGELFSASDDGMVYRWRPTEQGGLRRARARTSQAGALDEGADTWA